MHLTRVVLSKGGQKAILQGMLHVAPARLYKLFQKDVDSAVENGFQVFFEGVSKTPKKRALTKNESKIKRFFLLLTDLYPMLAEALGVSLQKGNIVYPEDAINADITFAELTRELDKNGFRCNFLLGLLTALPKRELKKEVGKALIKNGGLGALLRSSERWSLGNLIVWVLFRKANPILLDYRNTAALAVVQAHSNGRNIFVHYGQKHIKGLVDLLKKDGWTIEETTQVNLAEFL